MIVDLAAPTAERALIALVADAAAEAAARIQPPRLPLCLSYAEAGRQLGIGERSVRNLADRGVLRRPPFADEIRAGVVTTASVAEMAGWPVVPIEVAVTAA